MKKTTQKLNEREIQAIALRKKIHKKGLAGKNAQSLVTQLREERLYLELGHKSFNSWAQNDSPWSANYTYKISSRTGGTKAPPGKPAGKGRSADSSSSPAGVKVDVTAPTTVFRAMDKIGQEVPDSLAAVFEKGDTPFVTIYQAVADMRAAITVLAPSPAGGEIARGGRIETLLDHLNEIESLADRCRPWTLCFFCRGSRGRCTACSDAHGHPKGWLTQTQWQDATKTEKKTKKKT